MIKKIISGTLISSMALFALPNTQLELAMVAKAVQKKAMVLANMNLKDEVKENFGTLYDEYQRKLMKQRVSELTLITNYAENYRNMTNENSDNILREWVGVEETELALKKEYIVKFRKVMPSVDVIRYFQIENRIQLLREAKTVAQIPLASAVNTPTSTRKIVPVIVSKKVVKSIVKPVQTSTPAIAKKAPPVAPVTAKKTPIVVPSTVIKTPTAVETTISVPVKTIIK